MTAANSLLRANARSSVHTFTYTAPLTGEINAVVTDAGFDVSTPIDGVLEVDLDLLTGDDPRTDSEMHRRLDTQRFPRARACVRRVERRDGDRYWLSGELTLHGKTRPLEGDATVTLDGDRLHAVGALTLDLRSFGIKPPSLLLLRVHPDVHISIDLYASRDDA